MKRKIVNINEDLCNGCGDCVPNCHEGALQIIDGKARLISDLFCDGLGACLGHCPTNAITIEEREAEPYNEVQVMDYIVSGGVNVISAHLKHLHEHNELEYLSQALHYLEEKEITGYDSPKINQTASKQFCGCPGSSEQTIERKEIETSPLSTTNGRLPYDSLLAQWPIQLHLVNPAAGYFQNSDLLIAADCTAFSYANFHGDFLEGRSVVIACPKLDSNKEIYMEKLTQMAASSNLKSVTVLIMQVPCCGGLAQLAMQAVRSSGKEIPVRLVVIGVRGEILQDSIY